MAQRMTRWILALYFVFAVAAAAAHAQDYKPLLGDWNMTSESEDDPIKWTLSLKEVDGKLTAICAIAADAEKPAKNVTFADGVLKFSAPYEDAYYDIALKLTGNKLEGTWEGDGSSGKTYGFKN